MPTHARTHKPMFKLSFLNNSQYLSVLSFNLTRPNKTIKLFQHYPLELILFLLIKHLKSLSHFIFQTHTHGHAHTNVNIGTQPPKWVNIVLLYFGVVERSLARRSQADGRLIETTWPEFFYWLSSLACCWRRTDCPWRRTQVTARWGSADALRRQPKVRDVKIYEEADEAWTLTSLRWQHWEIYISIMIWNYDHG